MSLFEDVRNKFDSLLIELTDWSQAAERGYLPSDYIIEAGNLVSVQSDHYDRQTILDCLAYHGCQDIVDVLETCRPFAWVQDVWFWFCDL